MLLLGTLPISPLPLRRINTRGRNRPTGRFASRKMGRCLPWESSNELAWLERAELDPDVSVFYVQALRIEVTVAGEAHTYTPDGVAVRGGRVEVHEVKPDAEAAKAETQALAIAAARHLGEQGATYGFALESTLKAVPVYVNMQDVLRRLHRRVPEALMRCLVAEAQDRGPLSVAELVAAAARQAAAPEDVLALVAHHRLRMDLRRPVDAQALVWEPKSFPQATPILPLPTPPGPRS
jgi:hypothetical protein